MASAYRQGVDAITIQLLMDAAQYLAEIDKSIKALNQIGQAAQQQAKEITSLSTSFGQLGKSVKDIFDGLASGFGMTDEFTKFNKAIRESASVMVMAVPNINNLMKEMEQTAISLSANTIRGATDAAQSFFYLFSAGYTAEQSVAALGKVSEFATAGMFDMAKATTLAADAQAALGMKVPDVTKNTENLTRIMDVLVRANTLANANVQQFSIALTSKAGAALKMTNKTVEEGVAVLAAMADQGMKAELAGNALSRFTLLLNKSVIRNKEMHDIFGFRVFDDLGNMRNYADIIGNLEDILGDMTDEAKAATLQLLGFDARVQGIIMPLLGTSSAIRKYHEELNMAGGTTERVAKLIASSFEGAMKLLKNQWTLLAIDFGKVIADMVIPVIELITTMMKYWREIPQDIRTVITTVVLLVGALKALILLKAGLGALSGVVHGFSLLKRIPFTSIAAGITSVYTSIVTGSTAAATAVNASSLLIIGKLFAIGAIAGTIAGGLVAVITRAQEGIGGPMYWVTGYLSNEERTLENYTAALSKSKSEITKLKEEMTRNDELVDKMEKINSERFDKERQRLKDIPDEKERLKETEKSMEKLSTKIRDTARNLETAEKQLIEAQEGIGGAMSRLLNPYNWFTDYLGNEKKTIENYTKALTRLRQELKNLQDDKKDAAEAVKKTKGASQIHQYLQQLGIDIGQIGMDKDEIRVADIIKKLMEEGTSHADALQMVRPIIEELKRKQYIEKLEDMRKQANDLLTQMQQDLDLFGTKGRARDYAKFRNYLDPYSQKMFDQLVPLFEQLDAEKDRMEEADKLMEKFQKPEEKLANRTHELNEMLKDNIISFDVYSKAIMEAEKSLNKASSASNKFDIAAAGSAEALYRFEQFRDSNRGLINPNRIMTDPNLVGGGINAAAAIGVPGAGAKPLSKTEALLEQIRDIMAKFPKLKPADVGIGAI